MATLPSGTAVRGLKGAVLDSWRGRTVGLVPQKLHLLASLSVLDNLLLAPYLAGLPRDGRYKALQAHYALMLERKLSKQQILERYFNTVFFGNNAYGLAAAAEVYFGKKAADLTLLEGAFLMGLVRSPSGYDPIRYPEASRRRFKQVTLRLAALDLAADHQWLVRDQLALGETGGGVAQHAQFFGQIKVHGSCSSLVTLLSSG